MAQHESSELLVPRPLEHITVAKEAARAALSSRLKSAFGFEDRHSNALARMVVDPTSVRHQIEHPLIKRFPGGLAKFLVADIFSCAVSVSPINPRESERRTYPVAKRPGESAWPPLIVKPASDEIPVLSLTAESRAHVEWVVDQSALWLRNSNDLRESITLDGVLEPITVFLAEIHHLDGTPTVVVPISADGSSRISHCLDLTGFDPIEVVYRWPQASLREWRGKLSQIVNVQDSPAEDVNEERAAAHRSLILQARILCAVEPVRDGEPVSVVTAHRAIVGGIHVGHPAEWPEGSQTDEIADAVLDELVKDKKIKKAERDYMAGLIEPAGLKSHGFSEHLDARAAFIAQKLFDNKSGKSVSAGARGLVVKIRLAREAKPTIAAELIMRGFRSDLRPPEIKAVRSALERTINMSEWRSCKWKVTRRSPDELLDAAINEVRDEKLDLGPARLELGMLATYWLTSRRALMRDSRETDARSGASVIGTLLRSEHGIRQLHRVVIDGRSHQPLLEIDVDGNVIKTAVGGCVELTDKSLRTTFPSPEADLGRQSTIVNPSPQTEFARSFANVTKLSSQIHDLVRRMVAIQDDGIPVATRDGVPTGTANDIVEKLRESADRISFWARVSEANAPNEVEALEEVDLLAAPEEVLA